MRCGTPPPSLRHFPLILQFCLLAVIYAHVVQEGVHISPLLCRYGLDEPLATLRVAGHSLGEVGASGAHRIALDVSPLWLFVQTLRQVSASILHVLATGLIANVATQRVLGSYLWHASNLLFVAR